MKEAFTVGDGEVAGLEHFPFLRSEPQASACAVSRRSMRREGRSTRYTKTGTALMEPNCRLMGRRIAVGLAVLGWIGTAAPAIAAGATRDLPPFYEPGTLLNVSIVVDALPGTGVVGIEDVPPSGWTDVSNISDGGTYDSGNQKVKWPPFFDNLSRTVSYDVTPPGAAVGVQCFTGFISFDGDEQSTAGDDCVPSSATVPVTSGLGLIVMGLLLLAAAALVLRSATQGKQRCP